MPLIHCQIPFEVTSNPMQQHLQRVIYDETVPEDHFRFQRRRERGEGNLGQKAKRLRVTTGRLIPDDHLCFTELARRSHPSQGPLNSTVR